MARLSSIDSTRGLVMILMLLDHVREFFFYHAQLSDPVDLTTATPGLFFSRLCAHLCAPVFVLLTGTSAWIYQSKTSQKDTSVFLFTRGLVLILFELTIIKLAWDFSYGPMIYLQVIWAIGLSMIYLSGILWLPRSLILAQGLLIVFAHNLLDPITFMPGESGYIPWAIIHDRSVFEIFHGIRVRTSYPVLPWLGVISIGFSIGPWMKENSQRLTFAGLISLSLFLVLRGFNLYGEALPWSSSILSFLNLTKYPPSLNFLLLTLGIAFLLLRFFAHPSTLGNYLEIFGQVPMFFYIVHIYVVQVLYILYKHWVGVDLPHVIYLWIISLLLMHPLWVACRWYGDIKRKKRFPLLKYI